MPWISRKELDGIKGRLAALEYWTTVLQKSQIEILQNGVISIGKTLDEMFGSLPKDETKPEEEQAGGD